MSSDWGRIDAEGSVFVRTAGGERQIGSWQAGSAEEGIAFYTKRYDDLVADVTLLEARADVATADPTAVREAATKMRTAVSEAAAKGAS